MKTCIGGPLVLSLTQAAQLSCWVADGEVRPGEIDTITSVFDGRNGPRILNGGHIRYVGGAEVMERYLYQLFHALNLGRGFLKNDLDRARLVGALIMPLNYSEADTIRVEDIHNPENHEGPSVWGPTENTHISFVLGVVGHTGLFVSPEDDTEFYWQWQPQLMDAPLEHINDPSRVVGGKFEIVGHMTPRFEQRVSGNLRVRRRK
jgi:hypothetical protein